MKSVKYKQQFVNIAQDKNYWKKEKMKLKETSTMMENYSLYPYFEMAYSQVPIKRVGPNKRVGWVF